MLHCDFQFQTHDFYLDVKLNQDEKLLGIVGASGSGKTTFLKCLVGLLQPQQGIIQFNQRTLFDQDHAMNIPMHQRKIALIFQHALLFPHMNVLQNLCYAEKWVKHNERRFQFDEIVNLLELKPLIKRKAHQLSGGEAQRVSIGRALLSSPNLLLLDEPLTGLDHRLKQQILPFLKRIKDEIDLPMLYVTHHQQELDFFEVEKIEVKQNIENDAEHRRVSQLYRNEQHFNP